MNQSEWDACNDPRPMLEALRITRKVRKLRLLACACCRRVWEELKRLGPALTAAVELAERHADGHASDEELNRAWMSLGGVNHAGHLALLVVDPNPWNGATGVCLWVRELRRRLVGNESGSQEADKVEIRAQAALIRDLFGPHPGPALVNLSWLGAAEEEVVRLAGGIYHERAFTDLPILADALEEAGCPDPALLEHCRSGGEHARGCWVVDALMGKI
jgi:hypothetical protein